MRETQASISQWSVSTFGSAGSNLNVFKKVKEEVDELQEALEVDDNNPHAPTEIADIMIVLYRLADRMGVNIHDVIDEKMKINRTRKWDLKKNRHI